MLRVDAITEEIGLSKDGEQTLEARVKRLESDVVVIAESLAAAIALSIENRDALQQLIKDVQTGQGAVLRIDRAIRSKRLTRRAAARRMGLTHRELAKIRERTSRRCHWNSFNLRWHRVSKKMG